MKVFTNKNIHLKCFSLVLFLLFIAVLFFSGTIKYYLHPRMYPFLAGAGVIVILMLFSQFRPQPGSRRLKKTYLLFLLPISCGLIYPPDSLETTISRNRGISLEASGSQPGAAPETAPEGDALVITTANFIDSLNQIYEFIDESLGKTVTLSGFVYDPGTLEEAQFVLSRLYMTCCAADAGIIGIVCHAGDAGEFEREQWYEVTGVLEKVEYKGEWLPMVRLTHGHRIEKPQDIYVY